MSKLKHILLVTSEFPPQPGGIGNHAYHLALQLSEYGFEVHVITDIRSGDGLEEMAFDATLPFKVERIKGRTPRLFMYFRRIIMVLKALKNRPYVIATGKFSLWNVALCSLVYSCKRLAVIHGTEVNFKAYLLRKAVDFSLKRFNSIVAVSHFTKTLVSHLNREVLVIANAIDLKDWLPVEMSQKRITGKPVLTTVGRLSKRKGQLQVIKHLPVLLKVYPDLHYQCVGMSKKMPEFIKRAEDLGVASHVTFRGVLDKQKVKQVLQGTDIFVMLSTTTVTGDVEGFGIAILEANAMGIPAIGASGSGIADAIQQGQSGLLIDGTDAEAFVEAVTTILNNISDYRKGALLWAQEHQWVHVIKKYVSVIEGINNS
ncbi:glycosyltransferase family 4 protein [Aestuariivivens sediminicola]|uniref:glycosyltransferase family 4 protein n=1 Tax=Aestuariivivens sediminicola TaxID=2913560 RepID=UPI001F5839E6|nr:glycosyltransferase family 4 protein [Aestuariivivens sediminicola]